MCAKLIWLSCRGKELIFLHSKSEGLLFSEMPLSDALRDGVCSLFLMATTHRALLTQRVKRIFSQNDFSKSVLVWVM